MQQIHAEGFLLGKVDRKKGGREINLCGQEQQKKRKRQKERERNR